jgi:hypothetical protein
MAMTVAGFFAIDRAFLGGALPSLDYLQRRILDLPNQKTLPQGVYQIQLTPYTNKLDKR